ncbi:MAG: methylenetetrahydrofolate--tRNA-(uracil(54)-C(5))-methyltransferase (FADH(2)-oxidizing) TrmFO [Proteobacteria bacterium]|nr:methylenetetrahydrofolate--tRNA-(uracil(54)-C(5))-methyltransferase (FADH(2)-oxidizing) TrmFO [Pseudomonadota bacterium]
MEVKVIGGGLAGVEAAYQIAQKGIPVALYEMRPAVFTPAHKTEFLSELVCSNSLKSKDLSNAHGLLKEELRMLGSIILRVADDTSIPGGKALVVDRNRFSETITKKIEANPLIHVVRKEISDIPSGITVITTGPLTSDSLSEKIKEITGSENLSFFDAISPIVDSETIDMEKCFFGSRYMADADDYLNCPLTEDQYNVFYDALIKAERVNLKDFEKVTYFEGCLPIEIMAERGKQTLLFGPMKPVGIIDGHTGQRPFAVIQLRREDEAGKMYNIVGFQTKLTYTEQDKIFRLIPALKDASFLRYGSIHRNTYINSPAVINGSLQLKENADILFAGQITGVEGYTESTAMGLVAGLSASMRYLGKEFLRPPLATCIGSLLEYITTPVKNFQPMNVNFGLLRDYRKREKQKTIDNALLAIAGWKESIDAAFNDR